MVGYMSECLHCSHRNQCYHRTHMNSNYHHGDLARALIAATLDILAKAGKHEISMRAVARRAGVSATAPYRHFADKEALLAAAATTGFERLRERLMAADATATGIEAIAAQGAAYVDFAIEHPALFRMMFGPAPETPNDHLDNAGEAAYAVLIHRIARTWPNPAESETPALGYWSLIHGFTLLAMDGRLVGKGQPQALIAQLVQLFTPTGSKLPTNGNIAKIE